MPMIDSLDLLIKSANKPLINFYQNGTISIHYAMSNMMILDNFLHEVDINLRNINFETVIMVNVEQELLMKSMINDGEYSEFIFGIVMK